MTKKLALFTFSGYAFWALAAMFAWATLRIISYGTGFFETAFEAILTMLLVFISVVSGGAMFALAEEIKEETK